MGSTHSGTRWSKHHKARQIQHPERVCCCQTLQLPSTQQLKLLWVSRTQQTSVHLAGRGWGLHYSFARHRAAFLAHAQRTTLSADRQRSTLGPV